MPYAVVVDIEVARGRMDVFMPLMQDNAAASVRDEPGCQQFDICADPAQPDHVFLYEVYDDRAAFDAHLQSAHFASFDAATADMITTKSVRTYPTVIRQPG